MTISCGRWTITAIIPGTWKPNWEAELHPLRPRAYQDGLKIGQLEDRIEVIGADNARLKQRLADLTDKLDHRLPAKVIPDFVKANVPQKRKNRPGRKVGHGAATAPCRRTSPSG